MIGFYMKYSTGLKWVKTKHPMQKNICDALRNLVPFVQSKNREEHPWKNVTKSKNPPRVFFRFSKLYKWYQIAQGITYLQKISPNVEV